MSDKYPHAEIGERLRSIRATTRLMQQDFAARHNFNKAQNSHWETGFRRIPIASAEVLCDAYGLTLDFIYRGRRDGLSVNVAHLL